MILDKKIQSSITKNEDLWLYEVKLPWIKRYFESVYYSFEGNNKEYWNLLSKFKKLNLNNYLVWITRFNNYYIICFICLNNLQSEYFFVNSFDIFEVSLDRKNYFIFTYNNYDDKKWYFSNYIWTDYKLLLENNIFKIKNAIFDTEIYYKLMHFDNLLNYNNIKILKNDESIYLDIVDIFIYDDFFINANISNFDNIYNFLKTFNNKSLIINSEFYVKININKFDDLNYPKIKFNISILRKDLDKINLVDFKNLFLAYYTENISFNLINNKNIQNHFTRYFNDFTSLELDKLRLNFIIPDNIYFSDMLFEKFKLDLLKLRYNLFLLKEAYKLKDKKAEWNSEYTKLVNNRLNINKDSLERTIISYEKMFSKLLKNIQK